MDTLIELQKAMTCVMNTSIYLTDNRISQKRLTALFQVTFIYASGVTVHTTALVACSRGENVGWYFVIYA